MNESKPLTIQLPQKDSDRLEAEAKRLNVPPEVLAVILLQLSLAKVNPSINALAALWRLGELTKDVPPVDPVELIRAGREDVEKRGIL